jgi:polar amino acid transport system substrate-binding protein
MKKKLNVLALVMAVLMAASLLAGCGNTKPAPEEAKRTTLTVGFDAEYPPYGFMGDDGQYTGFDLELAQAVCDMEGWELVKKPINWDSKDMELESGSIDCIWNGFTMTGREDEYTWSNAYVDNSIVWVVKADSGIKTAGDLAGKTVVTQSDSSAYTALTAEEDNAENLALAASFKDLQTVADYNTAFANLDSGLVDAIAVDIGVAKYQLASRSDNSLVQLETPLSTEQYAIGFKLGNTELRDAVQADYDKLLSDGTVMKLAEKYEIADMVIQTK